MTKLDRVKKVIRKNYQDAYLGLFFTRNWTGDTMATVYEDNEVTVDICYLWSYFEVFGLTTEEEKELHRFYESLG